MKYVFYIWIALFTVANTFANTQSMYAIDITATEERRIPIAIVTDNKPDFGILSSVASILSEDLMSSARFIASYKKIDTIPSENEIQPVLIDFRNSKFDNVVFLSVAPGGGINSYVVEAILYDVFSEEIIIQKKYVISSTGARKVAHIVGDVIMMSLVGYEGDFNTKIMYVDEFGNSSNGRVRKISIVDRDGYNQRYLTNNGLAMSPTYSKARKMIYYSDFTNGISKINTIDVATGSIVDISKTYQSLSGYKLMSPAVSTDGNSFVFTLMQGNLANIYNLNFLNGQLNKITTYGLNVSSSFSPDGTHIVYTSDVGGRPALYVMSSNGWNSRRITFEKGNYMEPEWSPNGDWIVFTKLLRNIFSIGIIKPDGTDERILYSGYMAESPAWSPSGTQIAFAFRDKGDKKNKIKIIDTKGHELRIIESSGKASDLAWIKID